MGKVPKRGGIAKGQPAQGNLRECAPGVEQSQVENDQKPRPKRNAVVADF